MHGLQDHLHQACYDLAWSRKLSVACQYLVKSDPKSAAHAQTITTFSKQSCQDRHGANANGLMRILCNSHCNAKTSPIKQKQQKQTSTWMCTCITGRQTKQRLSAGLQQLPATAIANIISRSKAYSPMGMFLTCLCTAMEHTRETDCFGETRLVPHVPSSS
jgi:hypothetical protein